MSLCQLTEGKILSSFLLFLLQLQPVSVQSVDTEPARIEICKDILSDRIGIFFFRSSVLESFKRLKMADKNGSVAVVSASFTFF